MATWFIVKEDGTVERKSVAPADSKAFTLDELQQFVGGDIEVINVNERERLIVNEEGRLRKLPFNRLASRVVPGTSIVGNALVCTPEEAGEDEQEAPYVLEDSRTNHFIHYADKPEIYEYYDLNTAMDAAILVAREHRIDVHVRNYETDAIMFSIGYDECQDECPECGYPLTFNSQKKRFVCDNCSQIEKEAEEYIWGDPANDYYDPYDPDNFDGFYDY